MTKKEAIKEIENILFRYSFRTREVEGKYEVCIGVKQVVDALTNHFEYFINSPYQKNIEPPCPHETVITNLKTREKYCVECGEKSM